MTIHISGSVCSLRQGGFTNSSVRRKPENVGYDVTVPVGRSSQGLASRFP